MTSTIAQRALGYAESPFPVSFDGNGALYASALFTLLIVCSLTIMVGFAHAQRLWIDRKEGKTLAWAFRTLVVSVCTAAFIRAAPEVVYMIAYADASAATLQAILIVKRLMDTITLVPFLGWVSMVWLYGTEIEFAIKRPASRMWIDHRSHRLKRFATVVILSAAFAVTVTAGRLFT
jgi:hypothetical protein